jgi:hypothetical protein
MKTQLKNPIKNFAPVFFMLMTMFFFGFGCNTSKPTHDPLAGFHVSDLQNLDFNKIISGDYKSYINTLSPEEKKYLGPSPTSYFEDGEGQHAVKIRIGLNGTTWEHVLIYNKNNKRIKTIKYASGRYAS